MEHQKKNEEKQTNRWTRQAKREEKKFHTIRSCTARILTHCMTHLFFPLGSIKKKYCSLWRWSSLQFTRFWQKLRQSLSIPVHAWWLNPKSALLDTVKYLIHLQTSRALASDITSCDKIHAVLSKPPTHRQTSVSSRTAGENISILIHRLYKPLLTNPHQVETKCQLHHLQLLLKMQIVKNGFKKILIVWKKGCIRTCETHF